jgi:hypothetical protein
VRTRESIVPTVAETTRKIARATRSSVLATVNVWNGGVKKKFKARKASPEAARPGQTPPAAAATTTART